MADGEIVYARIGIGSGFGAQHVRDPLVHAFENAAFDMPVDSYSAAPVQTQFGWHVIKVSARDVAPAPSLDQMREQIVSNLSRQSFARVVETLRAGAAVEVRPYDEVLEEAPSAAAAQQFQMIKVISSVIVMAIYILRSRC